jgi:DNA helicase HerA-like ATPase
VLLVLDEAHTFASPDAETPLAAAVRDRIVQIAAEGRKYGLWLLLSTQRPGKIHPGILTQCDNLTLMRMNSPADLADLAAVFGFVPGQLLDRAARFIQGEALMAGGFVPLPTVVKVRDRITPEGGVDVPVPMAD